MQITKLQKNKDPNNKQEITPGNVIDINNRINTETATTYRKVVYLTIPIDSQADSISIKLLTLAGSFKKKSLTVGQVSSLIDQSWSYDSGNILINYSRPWHISSINSQIYGEASLSRVDGEAIAAEPTINGLTDLPLSPEFSSHAFAIKLSGEKIVNTKAMGGTVDTKTIDSKESLFDTKTVDAKDVKAADKHHKEVIINNFHGLSSIILNAYPTTPRIGIPEDLSAENLLEDIPVNYFWQQAGEHREAINHEADDRVIELFQDKITELIKNKSNDNSVILPIIIDSDVPCRWQLDTLSFDYRLKVSHFNDQSSQQKIQFDGQQLDSKVINLSLPDGDIDRVLLKIDNANQDNVLTPESLFNGSSNVGITLHNESWAGVSLVPEQAGFYAGMSVLLNYSGNDIEVNAQLMESNKGKMVSQGIMTLSGKGLDWKTIRFSDPVLLDAKPYWLLLRAVNGQVIWLGEQGVNYKSAVFQLDDNAFVHEKNIKSIALQGTFLADRTGLNVNTFHFRINIGNNVVGVEKLDQEGVYELVFDKNIVDKNLLVTQASKGIIKLSEPIIEYSVSL